MTSLIPNAALAQVDLRKLHDYCLNPGHPVGKHKAALFRTKLGLSQDDDRWLGDSLLAAARNHPATLLSTDRYGQRFRIDFPLSNGDKSAVIRSAWIADSQTGVPRLLTCYPL